MIERYVINIFIKSKNRLIPTSIISYIHRDKIDLNQTLVIGTPVKEYDIKVEDIVFEKYDYLRIGVGYVNLVVSDEEVYDLVKCHSESLVDVSVIGGGCTSIW